MFFIVNKTKKHITLPDIKISLGPRQAIDLDKIMDRTESEKSKHLKAAKSKGDIEVRIKDGEKKKVHIIQEKIDGPDIGKMKDEIIKEMKNEIKSLKLGDKSSDGLSKEDLLAAMRELMSAMPAKEVIIREGKSIDSDEEVVEIDNNLLGEINKRAVNKMVKDVKMESVSYKEDNKENDLMDNISELEDLLGE